MKTHMILIFLLLLIVLAALFQKPSVGKEHFYGYIPRPGDGIWGTSPACDNSAINLQEDINTPGRYWGWLPSQNISCAFYEFGNDVLSGYRYKKGNNGSKNCTDYCKDGQEGSVTGCINGWDAETKQIINCNQQQGNNMHCICQAGEGINHKTTNLDGTVYNVCIDAVSAKPDNTIPGRKWGWENGKSCVVLEPGGGGGGGGGSGGGGTIELYGQCGGKGGDCATNGQCVDGPYPGKSCKSGSCQRKDEWYHQCL